MFFLPGMMWAAEASTATPQMPDANEWKRVIAAQQKQIEDLQKTLAAQQAMLDRLIAAESRAAGEPLVVHASAEPSQSTVAGVHLSGDLRFRLDGQIRSANEVAGPLQNVRGRYRLRLNLDRALDERFSVHAQLSTGPLSNANTNDQDFGGLTAKAPFSLSEAYLRFTPRKGIELRAGRMEEAFADNMRFLWDDDVRFNGFQQSVGVPVRSGVMGLSRIEFRAGEYILSNPNVTVLSAASPYVSAGYQVGQKVRDANLFHPGVVATGSIASGVHYQLTSDVQLYRNPAQIQLASTSAGYPVLVNSAVGVSLATALSGTGNATTSPGGAYYSAKSFEIARVAYRFWSNKWLVGGHEIPAFVDFQASRNLGAATRRDAWMVSGNVGSVKKFGDVRVLYSFAVKDANALISQFTDDDLGTGTGVNVAVHGMRLDVGLTRFLQWQNLLFVQHERDRSRPGEAFFVPLQAGANATFRFLGQLAFTF